MADSPTLPPRNRSLTDSLICQVWTQEYTGGHILKMRIWQPSDEDERGEYITLSFFPEKANDAVKSSYINNGYAFIRTAFSPDGGDLLREYKKLLEAGDEEAILEFLAEKMLPSTSGLADALLDSDADVVAERIEKLTEAAVGRVVKLELFYGKKKDSGEPDVYVSPNTGRVYPNWRTPNVVVDQETGQLAKPYTWVPARPSENDGADRIAGREVADIVAAAERLQEGGGGETAQDAASKLDDFDQPKRKGGKASKATSGDTPF